VPGSSLGGTQVVPKDDGPVVELVRAGNGLALFEYLSGSSIMRREGLSFSSLVWEALPSSRTWDEARPYTRKRALERPRPCHRRGILEDLHPPGNHPWARLLALRLGMGNAYRCRRVG
jgi:hypothetical protein